MSGPIARRIRTWATVLVAVTAVATMQAGADTFYVNGSCGDNTWTGLSPVCEAPNGSKLTIQAGIDASVNGDTVIVADGTYIGAGNKNLDYGGRLIILRSQNGPEACIIDCEDDGRGFWFQNGETAAAVLEGFTIRNGNTVIWNGGAIRCVSASPTILNCVLANNVSRNGGGGAYFGSGSSATVINCTFSGNSARGGQVPQGGGMYNSDSSPTVTNCTFTGNDSSVEGGGMLNGRSSPTVTNCTFKNNHAGRGGGGMFNALSSPTVTNCTFSGNSAADAGGGGGMFNCCSSNPTVTNCTFTGNSAHSRGGGMYNGGGGGSSPTLTNCTFSGNSASFGGGMWTDCEGRPSVTNCIFWNDSPDEIRDIGQSVTTVRFSDVQGGWPGEGNINANPLFVDPVKDDYSLAPGSPCIDAADNTAVPPGIMIDLAGNPRFVDDPATPDTGVPGGAGGPDIVDMGAYEFPCDPCDMNCDGTVDASDIEFFIDILFSGATPCDPCTADTNGDGFVDAGDIEGFINCLFP